MAVQAQHPSNILLPNIMNRIRPSSGTVDTQTTALTMLDDLQIAQSVPFNLFHAYNSGLNFPQQLNCTGMLVEGTETAMNGNLVGSRKRQRQGREDTPPRLKQHVGTPPLISTNPSPPSTSGRDTLASLSSVLSQQLNAHFLKQREEIDELIKLQGERMKQILEEKSQRLNRTFCAVVEEGVLKRLRDKECELETMKHRCQELEEHVKQLHVESQFWQKLAHNNELMAANLRITLEHVVAQNRDQLSREGSGESEVDDAESSIHGETRLSHDQNFKESKELKEQECLCRCRVCGINAVSILLLPCRHLCLCKDCENKLDKCPLCRSVKNASVQVYMS